MKDDIKDLLPALADRYETPAFLDGDPSQFMHRYSDAVTQERAAFVAAALSYGSRRQFIPKIDRLLELYLSGGLLPDDDGCFYRLHTNRMVNRFLTTLDTIYRDYGSMLGMAKAQDVRNGLEAIELITSYFREHGASDLIPRNASSSCKRLCMFLRWMVRDGSPVDLGLWSAQIDKATLIIPLDTHVMQEARRLKLISGRTATMSTARRLTAAMSAIFPGDPTRADYALFGLGVDDES